MSDSRDKHPKIGPAAGTSPGHPQEVSAPAPQEHNPIEKLQTDAWHTLAQAANSTVDQISGTNAGQKFLDNMTPQLAASYQRGKDLAGSNPDIAKLTGQQKQDLDAYKNIHDQIIPQIPFHDRGVLTEQIESGIAAKVSQSPNSTSTDSPARTEKGNAPQTTQPESKVDASPAQKLRTDANLPATTGSVPAQRDSPAPSKSGAPPSVSNSEIAQKNFAKATPDSFRQSEEKIVSARATSDAIAGRIATAQDIARTNITWQKSFQTPDQKILAEPQPQHTLNMQSRLEGGGPGIQSNLHEGSQSRLGGGAPRIQSNLHDGSQSRLEGGGPGFQAGSHEGSQSRLEGGGPGIQSNLHEGSQSRLGGGGPGFQAGSHEGTKSRVEGGGPGFQAGSHEGSQSRLEGGAPRIQSNLHEGSQSRVEGGGPGIQSNLHDGSQSRLGGGGPGFQSDLHEGSQSRLEGGAPGIQSNLHEGSQSRLGGGGPGFQSDLHEGSQSRLGGGGPGFQAGSHEGTKSRVEGGGPGIQSNLHDGSQSRLGGGAPRIQSNLHEGSQSRLDGGAPRIQSNLHEGSQSRLDGGAPGLQPHSPEGNRDRRLPAGSSDIPARPSPPSGHATAPGARAETEAKIPGSAGVPPALRGDRGFNPGVQNAHVPIPGIRSEGSTSAATNIRIFTCSTRIEDKRYITGAEIALVAIMAAAGAARNRPDLAAAHAVKTTTARPSEQPTPRAPEQPPPPRAATRQTESAVAPIARSIAPGRTTDIPSGAPREPRSFTANTQITDKRYITGAEIALAALLTASGAARVRAPERAMPNPAAASQPQDKSTRSTQEKTPPAVDKSPANPQDKPATTQPAKSAKPDESIRPSSDKPTDAPREPKTFVTRSPIIEDKRYITGAEIGLAALMSAAGAARVRAVEPNHKIVAPEDSSKKESCDDNSKKIGRFLVKLKRQEKDTIPTEKEKEQAPAETPRAQPHATFIRRSVLMSTKDTLVSVAECHFHDALIAWLIADINAGCTKESMVDGKRIVEIKSRQQIFLPSDEEAAEFRLNLPKHVKPENLVTIVEETQIDLELLNSSLGPVMSNRSKPDVTLPSVHLIADEKKEQ